VSELRQVIAKEIRERGPISFSRYMELCLYHPQLGYYMRNAAQFGKAGDFYTSSDVHAVFGRLLSRQFDEMWRAIGSPEEIIVKELGPGRGLFAQDVLDWSEKKFPELFRALRYVLVEHSPALRDRAREVLKRHFDSGRAVFGSLLEPVAAPAIIFANEFFDAVPVEVISPLGMLHLDDRKGEFVETWTPASSGALEFLDDYSVHPAEDERLEVPLQSQKLLDSAATFDRGFVIIVDYGYTRDEQLAGRHRGTLKAIRQHSLSGNPYQAPGEQDITADANFTALAAAMETRGWRPEKLRTQSQFLMGIGEGNHFADAFEDCRLPQERAKVALQLKHLVTPAGIGESFHVLLASKGVEREKVQRLAGLNFGARDLSGR
jgi:SAM-dependent MidA family methyltransferase